MAFRGELHVFSSAILARLREDVDRGGKMILPPSVLDILVRQNLSSPMMFKLVNPITQVVTHCGVLEFIADEGVVIVPVWVMEQLGSLPGDPILVESAALPTATFSRFRPQCPRFLDITNPKAVLENHLRQFSCLTVGDLIPIDYNNYVYVLKVEETRPGDAVSILECDMEVEFSTPVGYVEPAMRIPSHSQRATASSPAAQKRVLFSGPGRRLDGKELKGEQTRVAEETGSEGATFQEPGMPDLEWRLGTIQFFRPSETRNSTDDKNNLRRLGLSDGRSLQ